jgi:hypothetical protein
VPWKVPGEGDVHVPRQRSIAKKKCEARLAGDLEVPNPWIVEGAWDILHAVLVGLHEPGGLG